MEICSLEKCTGCSACENKCPVNCITMEHDENGFFQPKIDDNKCIKCLLCIKVCPSNKKEEISLKREPDSSAFRCWTKDSDIRKNSSSGGIFSEVANSIFKLNGVVFGAEFDNKFNLSHVGIDNIDKLHRLRGSKYIQSNTSQSYKEALMYLKDDRYVLYSGTPCQIGGLKKFLGKNYEKLITVDILCHGVGSTKVFKDSLIYLASKYKSEPIDVKFRYKRKGYNCSDFRVEFENGKKFSKILYTSPYGYLFAKQLIVRPSCLNCKYSSENRVSDLTLGDYQNSDIMKQSKFNMKNGISIVLANNIKGINIIKSIKDNIVIEEVNLNETIISCSTLQEDNKYNDKAFREFFANYNNKSFSDIVEKEFKAPYLLKFQYFIGRERYVSIVKRLRLIYKKVFN